MVRKQNQDSSIQTKTVTKKQYQTITKHLTKNKQAERRVIHKDDNVVKNDVRDSGN